MLVWNEGKNIQFYGTVAAVVLLLLPIVVVEVTVLLLPLTVVAGTTAIVK